MKPKVVLAGGTGFIGDYLRHRYLEAGYDVVVISRKRGEVHWEDQQGMIGALEGAAVLINLAGKSVHCRYTEANKKEILESRLCTTQKLSELILQCVRPPALWCNAGTATIYRHAEDRPMTEAEGEEGSGFSVEVARHWEAMFFRQQLPATRRVALRLAIVLGCGGGALERYENLVACGLGGRQGSGNQMFSWIHESDVFNVLRFLERTPDIQGIVNCSAPEPLPNKQFMRALLKAMHRKGGAALPVWLLKAGAFLIGTETELLLKSRWVLPERLIQQGFRFEYPHIQRALNTLVNS